MKTFFPVGLFRWVFSHSKVQVLTTGTGTAGSTSFCRTLNYSSNLVSHLLLNSCIACFLHFNLDLCKINFSVRHVDAGHINIY